jgi:hypothetical protein
MSKNITITLPYIHAHHMVKILTKTTSISDSTKESPQVQFTNSTDDKVTFTVTIPTSTGMIEVTQECSGVRMDPLGVSARVPAGTVRKQLSKALEDGGSWVSVSLPKQSVSEALFASLEDSPQLRLGSVFQMKTSVVRTLRKRHSYLWSQNTVGGLIGVAYTDNGDCAHVYGTNHMLTTHYMAPIITPKNSGGSPQQCFLVLDYEVLALYETMSQGTVSMFSHDDSTCVIMDEEGTMLTYRCEPSLRDGNRALEGKYLLGVHEGNVRGELQDRLTGGCVTFERASLLAVLRDIVKRAGGKPLSYTLDARVRVEQGQDVCCLMVENRGNGASGVVVPIKSADGVVWEPTTKYHVTLENQREVEERDRCPVTYPARFLLDGLHAGRGEYVTLTPPQYFTDPLMVFCHDDPNNPTGSGDWWMLPGTMISCDDKEL